MTAQEIHNTMNIIRGVTLAYCGVQRPPMDEIEFLSVVVSHMTFRRLLFSTQRLINRPIWDKLVDNTVKKIISENF